LPEIPNYLTGHEELYQTDPRAAAVQWFREARYGLFIHYGLYSLLGRHEWVQLREKIPVAEYAKLAETFTAEKFDADAIVAMAADCGMKYVNLVTRHHDCFCLFRTAETDFTSLSAPAGRDLVAEVVAACDKYGLGCFLYYSHGRDWRHPHAPNNDEYGGSARPKYDPPEPTYAYGADHDLQKYIDFMTAQVTELLTQYAPVAGIWLDGIAVPMNGDTDAFQCQELYDHIHSLIPHVLVSYKQGLLGTEDFFTPEHKVPDASDAKQAGKVGAGLGKPLEICTTMIVDPISWGYHVDSGRHLSVDEVWDSLRTAGQAGANLLLNTGPLPEGSIDPRDEPVLREVGQRIRDEGWPE